MPAFSFLGWGRPPKAKSTTPMPPRCGSARAVPDGRSTGQSALFRCLPGKNSPPPFLAPGPLAVLCGVDSKKKPALMGLPIILYRLYRRNSQLPRFLTKIPCLQQKNNLSFFHRHSEGTVHRFPFKGMRKHFMRWNFMLHGMGTHLFRKMSFFKPGKHTPCRGMPLCLRFAWVMLEPSPRQRWLLFFAEGL